MGEMSGDKVAERKRLLAKKRVKVAKNCIMVLSCLTLCLNISASYVEEMFIIEDWMVDDGDVGSLMVGAFEVCKSGYNETNRCFSYDSKRGDLLLTLFTKSTLGNASGSRCTNYLTTTPDGTETKWCRSRESIATFLVFACVGDFIGAVLSFFVGCLHDRAIYERFAIWIFIWTTIFDVIAFSVLANLINLWQDSVDGTDGRQFTVGRSYALLLSAMIFNFILSIFCGYKLWFTPHADDEDYFEVLDLHARETAAKLELKYNDLLGNFDALQKSVAYTTAIASVAVLPSIGAPEQSGLTSDPTRLTQLQQQLDAQQQKIEEIRRQAILPLTNNTNNTTTTTTSSVNNDNNDTNNLYNNNTDGDGGIQLLDNNNNSHNNINNNNNNNINNNTNNISNTNTNNDNNNNVNVMESLMRQPSQYGIPDQQQYQNETHHQQQQQQQIAGSHPLTLPPDPSFLQPEQQQLQLQPEQQLQPPPQQQQQLQQQQQAYGQEGSHTVEPPVVHVEPPTVAPLSLSPPPDMRSDGDDGDALPPFDEPPLLLHTQLAQQQQQHQHQHQQPYTHDQQQQHQQHQQQPTNDAKIYENGSWQQQQQQQQQQQVPIDGTHTLLPMLEHQQLLEQPQQQQLQLQQQQHQQHQPVQKPHHHQQQQQFHQQQRRTPTIQQLNALPSYDL